MLYVTSSKIFLDFNSRAVREWTEDVPPTILFGLPTGSAAVEPTGALAVYPGSILHLECLFARKLGNPEWTWTSTLRRYLTGEILKAKLDIFMLLIYYKSHLYNSATRIISLFKLFHPCTYIYLFYSYIFIQGWAISARERDWKYRLSIYYAKSQDSGIYTCSTPKGLSNSIRVRVIGNDYISHTRFISKNNKSIALFSVLVCWIANKKLDTGFIQSNNNN